MTAELLHQSGQFTLYFNGVQYGPIADPGLFTLGFMMPGIELFPGQQMQMTEYAFEVPSSDAVGKIDIPVSPYSVPYAGPTAASLAAETGRVFGGSLNNVELTIGREAGIRTIRLARA